MRNASLARSIPENLRGQIRRGRGVALNKRVVAGAYEAVVGAMASGSFADAREFIVLTLLSGPEPTLGAENPVSEVQERQQRVAKALPVYSFTDTTVGFLCEVATWWGTFCTGPVHMSKKEARRATARVALESHPH